VVIAELLSENALFRLRAAQGMLGLADGHGESRLELACAKAIAVGDLDYRTIKGILAAGLEADPPPPKRSICIASRSEVGRMLPCDDVFGGYPPPWHSSVSRDTPVTRAAGRRACRRPIRWRRVGAGHLPQPCLGVSAAAGIHKEDQG